MFRTRTLPLFLAVSMFTSSVMAQPKAPAPAPAPAAAAPATAPAAAPAASPAPAATDAATEEKKEQARTRFEKGMDLLGKQAWEAALVEFMASRELYPARGNTQNAAIALRRLNRNDEAIDMFETLLRDFPNLSAEDKALAQKELSELRTLLGTIDVKSSEGGSQVVVDGRERGNTPLEKAIRVSSGDRLVRVYKPGFAPFEKRVSVAAGQSVTVNAQLEMLQQTGRITVQEESGKTAEVVIDGIPIGKTPYQGILAPGDHVVFLRGTGNLGSQPAPATVKLNQATPLVLALEPLDATLRVETNPAGAAISVDGVTVANGIWEGKLRVGRHKLEVSAKGFIKNTRELNLKADREKVVVELESEGLATYGHVFLELTGGLALGPGMVALPCAQDLCSGGLPVGLNGIFHAGFEFNSRAGVELDVGYMSMASTVENRLPQLTIVGKQQDTVNVKDSVNLRGLTVGAAGSYRFSADTADKIPVTLRIGAGVYFGSVTDTRTGYFGAGPTPEYVLPELKQSPSVQFIYVAPEARIGYNIVNNLELSLGLELRALVGLNEAKWDPEKSQIVASPQKGLAKFSDESIVEKTMFAFSPSLGLRYTFGKKSGQ